MTTLSSSSSVVHHHVEDLKSKGNDAFRQVCVSSVMPGGSGVVLVFIISLFELVIKFIIGNHRLALSRDHPFSQYRYPLTIIFSHCSNCNHAS